VVFPWRSRRTFGGFYWRLLTGQRMIWKVFLTSASNPAQTPPSAIRCALATPVGFAPTRRRELSRHFVPASRLPVFERQSSEARLVVLLPLPSDNGPKLSSGCRRLRCWELPCILSPSPDPCSILPVLKRWASSQSPLLRKPKFEVCRTSFNAYREPSPGEKDGMNFGVGRQPVRTILNRLRAFCIQGLSAKFGLSAA